MPEVIVAQKAPTAQQAQDGLPVYTMYADTPGSGQLPGPRSPGLSRWPGGKDYDSYGYVNGTPQEPTPSPQQLGQVGQVPLGVDRRRRFNPPPLKVLWEPPVYVPGQGWLSSAGPS